MGGSILGAKAIYKFLNPKHKKFIFIDNFSNIPLRIDNKKKITLNYFKVWKYIRNNFKFKYFN